MRKQVERMRRRPVDTNDASDDVVGEKHDGAVGECSEDEKTDVCAEADAAACVEEVAAEDDDRKTRRNSLRLLRDQAESVQRAHKREEERTAKVQARADQKQQRIDARQQEHRETVAREDHLQAQKTTLRPAVSARVSSWFKMAPTFIYLLQKRFNVRIKNNPKPTDVHKAYVRCLAKYHPDKYRSKAIEQQMEAEEIYKSLGNAYDAYKKKHHIN